jgi:hypothetical protein
MNGRTRMGVPLVVIKAVAHPKVQKNNIYIIKVIKIRD